MFLVTGSRDWTDECSVLYEIAFTIPSTAILVQGGAKGLDTTFGRLWARWGPQEVYPADWQQYGRSAGMIRNQEMVNLKPDLCLAFIKNDSPGASGCLEMARDAGIPVRVWRDYGSGSVYLDEQ
jgi:YspA, cpYpsA-related SLOG family